MSKLGISTGRIPNDGTGDTLLSGAVKINKNFDEIYNYFGDGTNLTFTNDGSSRWARTVLGIHTVSNVGIGTVIPRFTLEVGAVDKTGISLHVNGDAKVTGILSVGQGAILINGNNDTITSSNIVVTNRLSGSGIAGFLTSANLVGYATEGYVNTAILGLGTITSGGGESYWQSTAVGINTLSSVGIGTTNPTSKLTVQSTGSVSDGENAAHPFAIRQGTFDRTLWMGYATNIGGIGEEGAYINAASTGISRPIYISTRNLDQTPFVAIGTDRPTGTSGQMLQVTGGAYVSGNLGIGTKSPISALTVKGNTSLETLSVSGISTFAGITTVTGPTLFAKQLNVSGISTFNSVLYAPDGINIGDDSVVGASRNIEFSNAFTKRFIFRTNDNADFFSFSNYFGGFDRYIFEISQSGDLKNSGNLSIAGISTFAGITTVTGPTLFANQLSISGVSTTTSLFANNVTVSGVSTFNQIKFPTSIDSVNNRLAFGDSDQFHLHYNSVSAAAIIQTTSNPLWLRVNNGENALIANINGSVELYYNNLKKFETRETGVTITGTTFTDELSVSGVSTFNGNVGINTANQTSAFTVKGNTSLETLNVSGVSTLSGNTFVGSGITLYASTGIVSATAFYGTLFGSITNATNLTGGYANASSLNVSGIATISQGRIQANADANLRFGNVAAGSGSGRNIAIGDQVLVSLSGGSGRNIGIGELSYYDTTTGQYNIGIGERSGQKVSTGSYNVILGAYDGNSGNLDIRTSSNNVVLADGQGNIRQYINSSGNVGIKTTVITEALTVAGIVSATGFYGSLNAGQLTGALPAIDGSALIGVVGSGSGVVIEEDGTPVGTAGTINFGSNISVSFASGIATVSGASSVSAATTAYGLAGTPNLNVGVVTTTFLNATDGSRSTKIGETYIEIGEGAGSNSGPTYLDFHGPGGSSDYSTRFIQYRQSDIDFGLVGGFEILLRNNATSPFRIKNANNGYKYFDTISNSVQLYNTDNKKFETTGYGVSVYGGVNAPSGIITASSFTGSGSGLTNLPAGQLTGALPAIDGSALLNVTATGTGVAIHDDQVNVGSASTINFGTGLDVTFSAGIATITASGGSLQSRTTVTGVTTSIPNLGIGNTNITGFKSYALLKVGLSTAGWLRLYTDSTSRANDVSRSQGEDPTPGSGVIAEVITTGISTTQIISPFVMGGNLDNPADTTIYASITNLSGTTQAITANLTILQLEA